MKGVKKDPVPGPVSKSIKPDLSADIQEFLGRGGKIKKLNKRTQAEIIQDMKKNARNDPPLNKVKWNGETYK